MFVNIVGFTVHNYIQRRRLTEAARLLVFSDKPIMEIALFAGYETQQSFTIGFKKLFKCSPQAFRKKRDFYPFQLKFAVNGQESLRGDQITKVYVDELVPQEANSKANMGYKLFGLKPPHLIQI